MTPANEDVVALHEALLEALGAGCDEYSPGHLEIEWGNSRLKIMITVVEE